MAEKEQKKAVELPEQSDEAREAALRRAPGGTTATGLAAARLRAEENGEEEESSEDQVPEIAGGDSIKGDYAPHTASKPTGAQAAKAAYTTTGTIPSGFGPSPSGPQPLAALAATPEEARKIAEDSYEAYEKQVVRADKPKEIDDLTLERMSGAELRAVAHDRGYDLGDVSGARSTRTRFRAAQEEDENLEKQEGGKKGAKKRTRGEGEGETPKSGPTPRAGSSPPGGGRT